MKNIVAIIGAGNMGSAFHRGLVQAMPDAEVRVCDRNAEKVKELGARLAFTDPAVAINGASVVLLAVKPQSARELLSAVSLKNHLVISIMAGIGLKTLQELTGSPTVIRAMPNLPASVGQGMTGWVASKGVTSEQKVFAKGLFSAVGREMELADEKLMDALTALSGSGPAYFFLLAELLAAKAEREGFSKDQASLLARQTLIGSGALLAGDQKTPGAWRTAVTSKAGVTEAALTSLRDHDLETIMFEAIDRAIARSHELNA